jgi:very-short-patch-repair endonuclease
MNIPFEKSFASNQKSKYWSSKNKLKPEDILNNRSHTKYWFYCIKCKHDFDIALSHIHEGKWCKYCNSGALCEDLNCLFCLYKSFASNLRSRNWDTEKNGDLKPRDITRSCGKVCYFVCEYGHSFCKKINYIYNGKWCSVCCNSKRLCLNENCQKCFNNSFASHPKTIYWNYEKNNQIKPREVFRCNKNKFWFSCIICMHIFDISLDNVSEGKWCKYCKGNDLCDNENCEFCFNKSFASCEKSKYWLIDLNNGIIPREICRNSGKKCWFKCDVCYISFKIYLPSVTGGHWCNVCKNKTELKLFKMLSVNYPTLINNYAVEWCKNIRCLPFDFCIPELKIIIELDGIQHFKQVRDWSPPEKQYETDIYKQTCANNNDYSTIRLLQEDVWNDRNDWFLKLQNAILEIISNKNEIQNIYICNNNTYDKYL